MQEKLINIAALTIGQSPRDDITPELKNYWGNKFNITEKGALDNYDYQEIQNRFSPNKNEEVLVTRLNDGKEVKVSHKSVYKSLNEKINDLPNYIDLILLLCTGVFGEFQTNKLIIKPQELLDNLIKNIIGNKKLGTIIPSSDQRQQIINKWAKINIEPEIKVASPYKSNDELKLAAETLKKKKVDLIYMDCLGYSIKMKKNVYHISGKKVIIPRLMLAAIIKELF